MNLAAVADECIRRVQGRFRVVASLVAGSAARGEVDALDVDLCIVVLDNVLRKAHLQVLGTHVDLFVCGIERLRWEFNRQQHLYLVPLFATGKYWHGERGTIEKLQDLARTHFEQPAPFSDAQAFAVRHRCHSLLRKFERACRSDDAGPAALMAATLVQLCVESYLELHRIWVPGLRYRLALIAEHDPQAALTVKRVLAEALNDLQEKPRLIRDMVVALVGEDPSDEEVWVS